MERERELHRNQKPSKAKVRAQAQGLADKEQSRTRSTVQPDKRLARIVSQGEGQYQTYDPAKDKTGKGAQNRQFLDKYIKAHRDESGIKKLEDGRYQIDRGTALQAIEKSRGSEQSAFLSDKTSREFKFKGEKQKDGSLIIDPAKLLKNKAQARFHNTLVNRLESALAIGEKGLSQLSDGRYRLTVGNVKAVRTTARERQAISKIDQRLARIVGTDTGASMTYDPMNDRSGQASKNTLYLDGLAKQHSFVKKNGGHFFIDRHAANIALAKTYKSTVQDQVLDPKISGLFKNHCTQLEQGIHGIDPQKLFDNPNHSQHYQRVVNTLEKGLREGAKGLFKTDDGIYLLNTGPGDSRSPNLTPGKNWEHWHDVNQMDSLKAQLAASPMFKEQEKSPSPSISPSSPEKKKSSIREKIAPLTEMQDEREKKQQQIRVDDQTLAQRRQKLEQQLAVEQGRLNQDLLRNWKASGVNNAHMQYRPDKNQHPLKAASDLAPSTQKEYAKIARRLENIHPLQMPKYLENRADQVSRQTWWKEHAVARRMLRSAETEHFNHGETQQGRDLAITRQQLQKMDYQSHRTQPALPNMSKSQSKFSESFYNRLLDRTQSRGDQELHDALVITRTTGLRPEELQKGVHFGWVNRDTNEVAIHVQGAKKSSGIEEAPDRYKSDHGQDRLLIVISSDIAEIAERHSGHFKPESNKEALRMRLNRATADLDPGDDVKFSFYTLRHQAADDMREQGYEKQDIALHLGHQSERTQQEYGIKHA